MSCPGCHWDLVATCSSPLFVDKLVGFPVFNIDLSLALSSSLDRLGTPLPVAGILADTNLTRPELSSLEDDKALGDCLVFLFDSPVFSEPAGIIDTGSLP